MWLLISSLQIAVLWSSSIFQKNENLQAIFTEILIVWSIAWLRNVFTWKKEQPRWPQSAAQWPTAEQAPLPCSSRQRNIQTQTYFPLTSTFLNQTVSKKKSGVLFYISHQSYLGGQCIFIAIFDYEICELGADKGAIFQISLARVCVRFCFFPDHFPAGAAHNSTSNNNNGLSAEHQWY